MIRQPAIVFGDEDMGRPEIEIGDSKIAYFRRKRRMPAPSGQSQRPRFAPSRPR
jgi:hypothetical protein